MKMVGPDEIQAWLGQLHSGKTEERREAVRRLGDAGEPAVGPLLDALASTGDSDERWYLALALSRIGSPAVRPLIAVLREKRDPQVRRYVAAALSAIGEDAVEALIRLLGETEEPDVRGFAALALGRIGEPAIGPLSRAVEAGGPLGLAAGQVLWRMEDQGLQALLGAYGLDESCGPLPGSGPQP